MNEDKVAVQHKIDTICGHIFPEVEDVVKKLDSISDNLTDLRRYIDIITEHDHIKNNKGETE